jgi:sugar phosphate isomerase/epimerase
MRTGVSMWSFHRTSERGRMSVTEFVRTSHDLGVGDIELLNVFWKETDGDIRNVTHIVRDLGLSISAYDVGNDFGGTDRSEFQKALDEVRRGVDVAGRLDTNIVRVFGAEPKKGVSDAEALNLMLEGLSAGADYAGEHGIKLALENHGELYGTASQLVSILDKVGSPHLGLNFVVGNFVPAGDDANSAIGKVFKHVLHVHMKDFRRAKQGDEETFTGRDSMKYTLVGPGEGKTDVPEFMRKLASLGYGGVVSLENESAGDELDNTRKYLKVLRDMMP